MRVEINRINNSFHLEARNSDGSHVHMDGSQEIGGNNQGFRPMQMLLAGIGGCSAMDLISILKKQKQGIRTLKIEVEGKRETSKPPSVFTDIHINFKLTGNIDEDKAQRAVLLAVEKYCSVAEMLKKTARITHSFEIIKP